MNKQNIELIVGDNAFHGISHLSQERARYRLKNEDPSNLNFATELVNLSIENGATGFMFSVSETTLSILKGLNRTNKKIDLYAIVPYAYEYVRLATTVGGLPGLAKNISKKILLSNVIFPISLYSFDFLRAKPSAFLKAYLIYEISRIQSVAGKKPNLKTLLLHEVITDMVLALNLDWFAKDYINFLIKNKIRPGFETRNFPALLDKFEKWGIDISKLTLVASFNKIGFQMNPSKLECERALKSASNSNVIAMSIFAAGYLKPVDAIPYITSLSHLSGVVVGVSKKTHALNTFKLINQSY